MKLNGAELIIHLLERQGIDKIAGIPGGSNLPLYNALCKSKILHVLTRHEQGAGFFAQGMTRATGKVAVCFATSGPGATNLLTAIADAKLDSIAMVAITGQVPGPMSGTDAFQEIDIYGMSLPATKHNFLVRTVEELLTVIPDAFRIAMSGRPGPVLVDVPKDVQNAMIEIDVWPSPGDLLPTPKINEQQIEQAVSMIANAKRPVLYIGGGIINAGASDILRDFARKNSIPVASTLLGLGVYPTGDPLYLGMLGMHGSVSTNKILHQCDLLLAFGVRFDDRATGKLAHFCPDAKVIHIEIDRSEIDKLRKSDLAINGDVGLALHELYKRIPQDTRSDYWSSIDKKRAASPFPPLSNYDQFHPYTIIRSIAAMEDSDAIISTDVGHHQMWVAQVYPFKLPRTLLTSGGLGTMGFGLPAAIGAAMACPDRQVICFSGDGSLLMNIQELATAADFNTNVKVILFNNGHLGLVRQQQELFYNRNFIASRFQNNTDFVAIAKGFGINSFDLGKEKEPLRVLSSALSQKGQCLINVPIEQELNVLPMVPPGGANHEMIGG